MPKLIALHVVLDKTDLLPQVKLPTEGEPAADVRFGFAEGLARRGEIDRARAVAQLPGRIEDRFAAQVLVAANIDAAAANPDFDACVSILEKDWGSRDLPGLVVDPAISGDRPGIGRRRSALGCLPGCKANRRPDRIRKPSELGLNTNCCATARRRSAKKRFKP